MSADHVLGLVCDGRNAATGPSDLAKLWQIATTMDLARRLQEDGAGCCLEDVITDVEMVSQHLELSQQPSARDRARELEIAHLTSQRVLVEISPLSVRRCDALWPSEKAGCTNDLDRRREALISSFGSDARSRRRETIALMCLALIAFTAAVGIAVGAASTSGGASSQTGAWLPPLLAALMAFVVGGALLHGAQRHRLASLEATRIQRQLNALEDLLEPLPPALQAITRATLLRQLFPRLREDSEPWTEPPWPDIATALEAIGLDRSPAARLSSDDEA